MLYPSPTKKTPDVKNAWDKEDERNSLWSIYYISKIMGLSPYTLYVRKSRLRHRPSPFGGVHTCLSLVLMVAFVWPTFEYQRGRIARETSEFYSVSFDGFRTANNILMAINTYLIVIFNGKRIRDVVSDLLEIDDHFAQLNLRIDQRRIMKNVTVAIAITYSTFLLISIVDLVIIAQKGDWVIYLNWLGCLMAYTVNITGTCQFISYLYLIFARYELLNVYISSLAMNDPYINVSPSTLFLKRVNRITDVSVIQKRTKTLDFGGPNRGMINVICQIHDKLCTVSKKLNGMYSIHLLHMTSTTFITLVIQLYFFYLMFSTNDKYTVTYKKVWMAAVWGILPAFDLFSLCFICTKTIDEANNSGNLIHKMNIDEDDELSRCYVEMFSMQMMHQKVEFTACGFFSMDFSIIYMIIGAVTTYLIFLIQFEMASRSINQMTQNMEPKIVTNNSTE